ncbi:MAG: His-Xaa-Ser system protein HxsD [Elusimicrobia bacterium]|nr:His-Xaa-Ser system protein HxsD [Elusimicrobiota bacterium]
MPTSENAEIAFELDENLYPLEAVQNAVYVFTDRAYVRVERSEPERLKVVMTVKAGAAPSARVELKGEFDNELIHQVLRQRISASNQKIREFIVTKALVSAQPAALVSSSSAPAVPAAADAGAPCPECVESAPPPPPAAPQIDAALEKEIDRLLAEIESGDGAADPLGVSVPWEEAFGGKDKKDEAPKVPKAKAAKAKRK